MPDRDAVAAVMTTDMVDRAVRDAFALHSARQGRVSYVSMSRTTASPTPTPKSASTAFAARSWLMIAAALDGVGVAPIVEAW